MAPLKDPQSMMALLPLPHFPPQDVSSEKLPHTPEAGPTASEALKHEQEVPSVPCTTATIGSVFTTSTALLLRARISCKNRHILVPPQGSSRPLLCKWRGFASGKRRLQLAALASDTNQCGWNNHGRLCTAG